MALNLEFKKKNHKKNNTSSGVIFEISNFFDKNPLTKIFIPILIFVILSAIFLIIFFGDGVLTGSKDISTTNTQPISQNEIAVLPENNSISDKKILEIIKEDPLSEDILSSAKYTGFTVGSSGLKTALISIGSNSDQITIMEGDFICDSEWEAIEITKDYVNFKAGELTKTLNR